MSEGENLEICFFIGLEHLIPINHPAFVIEVRLHIEMSEASKACQHRVKHVSS